MRITFWNVRGRAKKEISKTIKDYDIFIIIESKLNFTDKFFLNGYNIYEKIDIIAVGTY